MNMASSRALSNLRAFVIQIVLAFHSMLAYLGSLPASTPAFTAPPYRWRAFPIVDSHRWFGFDLFCAWQDVYLMSLMFFLSGLFVWSSLARKGSLIYVRDRLVRLALPLSLAVSILMPIAHYPTYSLTTADPSIAGFWQAWLSLPFWPCGPQWFLWYLLALNLAAAFIHGFAPQSGEAVARFVARLAPTPARFYILLASASALAYVPLALAFTPWEWLQFGPFSMQLSRPLHYIVYFVAGIAAGGDRLETGLLAADGMLPRAWPTWLAIATVTFVLWLIPTALTTQGVAADSLPMQVLEDIAFSLACAGSCMLALALVLRFTTERSRLLDGLSENAFGMYMIHYPFVVWLQYALLGFALPAVLKFMLVFAGTLSLSWPASSTIRRLALAYGSRRTEAKAFAKLG
jgi:hypothetical protein